MSERAPKGRDGLTERERRIVASYLLDGLTFRDAGTKWGVSHVYVQRVVRDRFARPACAECGR